MVESTHLRHSLVIRFKKIRGQIQAIERMLQDKSCQDIFIQLSAVKSALDKASLLVLENHMQSCLLSASNNTSLDDQKNNLIQFIRNYKYGNSSMPYVRQDIDTLLYESAERTGFVIKTLEDFQEDRCSDVLKNTSEIRGLLGRVGLILFESEIEHSVIKCDESDEFDNLENILNMAKKFII